MLVFGLQNLSLSMADVFWTDYVVACGLWLVAWAFEPASRVASRAMRLLVARCEVRYSGRLQALLPEALRLVVIKADGSVMVHSDAGGYKPENWMTPPTVIEESADSIVVRRRGSEDRLDIRLCEVLSDVVHDM